MIDEFAKEYLHGELRWARDALVWKLDGLGEYEVRRPLTATGTNLLGLVKHVAGVGAGYFGFVFDRPFPEHLAWVDDDDAEENADLWVPAEESTEEILALYHRVWAHADATIEALDLEASGVVPWWGERRFVTLHQILVHVIAEINRHAGHADILREQIDAAAGLREGVANLPDHDEAWWQAYRARIEEAALAVQAKA